MAQVNLPDWTLWVAPILGGTGILGFIKFIVDRATADKDTLIQRLERQIELDQDNHGKEIKRLERIIDDNSQTIKNFNKTIDEAANELEKKGIDGSLLRRMSTDLADAFEDLEDYQNAAKWVNYRRNKWISEAVAYAENECPDIPNDRINEFKDDVSSYVDWLYNSLSSGFCHDRRDYITDHALGPFPYRAALRYLSQVDDFGQLNANEITAIKDYTYELYQKVSS